MKLQSEAGDNYEELSFHAVSADTSKTALDKYRDLMAGDASLLALAKYEVLTSCVGCIPGALGLLLRQVLYKSLFRSMGKGVTVGRSVTLQHPSKISIGPHSAISDYCVLSARGSEDAEIAIGDHVFVGRNTIIKTRHGRMRIDSHAIIAENCHIASISNVIIGQSALIASSCRIGGANHRMERVDIPIASQGVESRGGVVIGPGAWLGSHVIVNDGVKVGQHSVIGAGSVVTRDIPDFSVAYGVPARVVRRRGQNGKDHQILEN